MARDDGTTRLRLRSAPLLLTTALLAVGCNALFGLEERPRQCDGDSECGTSTECQTNRCVEGLCQVDNAEANTPCSEHADGLCNGSGVCKAPSCSDQVLNQGESDIDCGGPCPPCADGLRCSAPSDCASGFCPERDGVCCGSACEDRCMACLASKTDGPNGSCVAIVANTDPDGECLGDPLACEVAGCNGDAGAPGCNRMAAGEVCRPDADPIEGGCDKAEVCGASGPCPDDVGSNLVCEPELNEKSTNCAPDCGIAHIAAGVTTSCAVRADNSAACWGYLVNDQNPVPVTGLTAPSKLLVMAYDTACVIRQDDTVACWGESRFGALGNGTTQDSFTAVQGVKKLGGAALEATSVSLGFAHGCAVEMDHTVWCWGLNYAGQLGNASAQATGFCDPAEQAGVPCSTVAVQVSGGINNAESVFLGFAHSCAVLTNGTVKCWGLNESGQIGCSPAPGPNQATATPVQLGGLSGIDHGSAGWTSSCVATSSGIVRCFGDNAWGQLGNGTTTPSCLPVQVQGLTNVSTLSGGWSSQCYYGCDSNVEHYCALDGAGSVACWGAGFWGQLGGGFTGVAPTTTPIQVLSDEPNNPPLTGVQRLVCGGRNCFTLMGDGTARSWGANDYGQLGSTQAFGSAVASGLDLL